MTHLARALAALRRLWRSLVASEDPNPKYSTLDRMDGRHDET